MKIAQIAPIMERVPPHAYGGTERVISTLTEELVRRGHEVTLFASGDSLTSAKLSSLCTQSLRAAHITDQREINGWTLQHIGAAYERAGEFDVIHDHCGVFSLPTAQLSTTPVIQTMHGAFFDHNIRVFQTLKRPHVVTISQNQGADVTDVNFLDTVYNGLQMDHYPFADKPGKYLLYVGRITPQKGTHLAVRLAHKTKLPLIMAAKLDPAQKPYFKSEVEPYLSSSIRWIGEVDEAERNKLMTQAKCFIHPGLWREPFGLTLIEAMACGCPVVALENGAIPEIIDHGRTGFIANTLNEMAEYVQKVDEIDRKVCREHSLKNFSATQMADSYERLYRQVLSQAMVNAEKIWQPSLIRRDWLFSSSYSLA